MEAFEQELGPFSHHVYLACCANDFMHINELRKQLESLGLKCALRNKGLQDQVSVLETRIKADIKFSRKIVVYVTEDYMNDHIHTLEVKQMKDKARQFSRDKVIILKDSQSQLTGQLKKFMKIECTTFKVTKEQFVDVNFAKTLREAILSGKCTIYWTLTCNHSLNCAVGHTYKQLKGTLNLLHSLLIFIHLISYSFVF